MKRQGDRIEAVKNEDVTVLLVEAAKRANRMGLEGLKVDDFDVDHDDNSQPISILLHGYNHAWPAEPKQ